MEEKSVAVLELLEALRNGPIEEDWNEQLVRDQRPDTYSQNRLQLAIGQEYAKEVGTKQLLRTVGTYTAYNQNLPEGKSPRVMGVEKLKYLLQYLFLNESKPYGWPSVTRTVKAFEDGRFFPLISEYVESANLTELAKLLNSTRFDDLGPEGVGKESPHVKLVMLAMEAKEQYQRRLDEIRERDQAITQLRGHITSNQDLIDRLNGKMQDLRNEIAKLEGSLEGKGGDKSDILKRINKLKQFV